MSNDQLFTLIKSKLSEFERQTGVVPSVFQLAAALEMAPKCLADFLSCLSVNEQTEGTSSFKSSLKQILLASKPRVRDTQVLLYGEHNEHLGIVSTKEANQMAQDLGLMLFLMQPDLDPPVARFLDYGKFKFTQEKKTRELKKNYKRCTKQVTIRETIADHDLAARVAIAVDILSHGNCIELIIQLKEPNVVNDAVKDLLRKFTAQVINHAFMDGEPDSYDGLSISATYKPKRS